MTHSDEEWVGIQHQIADFTAKVADMTRQLTAAQQRIAEWEAQKMPPPPFVKANRPERGAKARKKRAPEEHHVRQREEPTRVVLHPIERCPDCQGRLSRIHVGRRRPVVEVPPPPPGEVIEHQAQRGWCA